MFQVVICYFGDRYASFFAEKPILKYTVLLDRIKSAIPCLKELDDDLIRVAYQDVLSNCFINISDQEQLHLVETFRNVVSSAGDDGYDRINLKVWQSDSPSLLRKKVAAHVDKPNPNMCNVGDTSSADASNLNPSAPKTIKRLDFTHDASEVVDWKENRMQQIDNKLHWLEDKKIAMETHLRELEVDVPEPMRAGNYRVICGNCHIRGHRADGNRNKNACNAPVCTSYFICGQKNKHPEHFDEIRKAKKDLKELKKEIDDATLENRNLLAFQSKSISAFSAGITPRLTRAFGEKYSLKTARGKLALQKDISILRAACNNKIPEDTGNDRELFTSLLERQTMLMSEMKNTDSDWASTSSVNNSVNTVTVSVSPVHSSYKHKKSMKRCRKSKRHSTDSSSSYSSDSSISDSLDERKAEKSKRKIYKDRRKRKKYRGKSYKTKRRHRSSSSSSDSDNVSSDELRHKSKSHKHSRHAKRQCEVDGGINITAGNNTCTSVSNNEMENEQCSLSELATIAVAIHNEKR